MIVLKIIKALVVANKSIRITEKGIKNLCIKAYRNKLSIDRKDEPKNIVKDILSASRVLVYLMIPIYIFDNKKLIILTDA